MRTKLDVACLALIALGVVHTFSTPLEAQKNRSSDGSRGRSGVCFYTDENYRGEEYCANSGEERSNVGGRYNDKFSSLRLFGGAEVTVFENDNFRGPSRTFSGDVANLRDWNDRITSFRVGGRVSGGAGGGSEPNSGACFYTDAGYRGQKLCLSRGQAEPNVGNSFNDKISSVRVFGRARVVVYEHENFRGDSRTITSDVVNLGDFNDRITSIEVR